MSKKRAKVIELTTKILNNLYWIKTSFSTPKLVLIKPVPLKNLRNDVHKSVIRVFTDTRTDWIASIGIKFTNTSGKIVDTVLKLNLGELNVQEAPEVFNKALDTLLDNGCFIDGNKLTRKNFISYTAIIINVDDLVQEQIDEGLMQSLQAHDMFDTNKKLVPLSTLNLIKPFF